MASTQSAIDLIAEARGIILILMQEGDHGHGFENPEWADEMYIAWELTGNAVKHIEQAEDFE